ncbi:MAG TPA: signal peptidase I [Candidatus Acidoferrales bacterium]|nr:signal peptidase I [Candidatus Acidoferrales bacterium]
MNWKRGSIALLLSILQPGAGQIYNRNCWTAILYLSFVPCSLFVARELRLLHTFGGLVTFAIVNLPLSFLVVAEAARSGLKSDPSMIWPARKRLPLVLAIILAALNFAGLQSGFYVNKVLGIHGYLIVAESMAPTLVPGDRIAVDDLAYRPRSPDREEVIVVTNNEPNSGPLVKRVIAVGGDTLTIDGAGIMLNGQLLREPHLVGSFTATGSYGFGIYKIPPGQFFVMGDNRGESFDSRSPEFGAVDTGRIRGKPLYTYFSKDWSRVGKRIE